MVKGRWMEPNFNQIKFLDPTKFKGKLSAWMVSKCSTPGQREDYVKELKKYMTVDGFGSCNGKPIANKPNRNPHDARYYKYL